MIETVANFLDKFDLANKKIIVGFSGGYDSLCLLDILLKLRDEKGLCLIAAHLNHNWRGDKSKQEQIFCQEFCKRNQIEFYTETLPDNVKKTETEARELRYKFFSRTLEKFYADAIFTAHNFDDNAETILYRVFKGTGIVGLKGIQEHRDCYYRPLLSVSRKDIEFYCKSNNLNPNNDNSNQDTKYKRNLIRCDILPIIEHINPEIKRSLNKLSFVAQSECSIIDEYLSRVMSDISFDCGIKTEKYRDLSEDVKKRVLYNLIYASDIDYDLDKINDIYNFIENTISASKPSKMSISLNKWLYVDMVRIEFISDYDKSNKVINITGPGKYFIDGNEFVIEECDKREAVTDESTAYVNLSGLKDLVIRTRRQGDLITPLGSVGSVKLKKYLIDKKIPQYNRDKLILLCDGKNVLWVSGVGLSDRIKTIDKPTHKLTVKYKEKLWN